MIAGQEAARMNSNSFESNGEETIDSYTLKSVSSSIVTYFIYSPGNPIFTVSTI